MGGKEKKKYQSGAATQYVTRAKALKKLKLSLADFRRLCIIKGIYPHEPRNRKKVSRGSSVYKTFYFKKDIQFLLHEPLINKFRENKIYARRLARAKGREERETYDHLKRSWPKLKVDHVVRERYPSFIDALRDVDDALCMCNLFASLPKKRGILPQSTQLCRRLSVEFMQFVIASRTLRKVFVSIKGYYFQADIMGQPITWLVPHSFAHTHFRDVDFRVMVTFTKFYSTMLGFVLYRLYHSLNFHYPPKVAHLSSIESSVANEESENPDNSLLYFTENDKRMEVVSSLNVPLLKQHSTGDDDDKDDDVELLEGEMTEEAMATKRKREEEEKFTKLFEGSKFFLSREVPKEQLVFVIRSFGGEVSWDSSVGVGSTFAVDDETITHQVVDRPSVEKTYISRYYVQPQWVFDSVNARLLLPLNGYLPGEVLPPHLSPFVAEEEGSYVPPERQRVLALQRGEDPGLFTTKDEEYNDEHNTSDDSDEENENPHQDDDSSEDGLSEEEDGEKEKMDEEKPVAKPKKRKAIIKPGKTDVDVKQNPDIVAAEEKKLAIMMIPKRRRRLYNKATFRVKRQKREATTLALKRKLIDEDLRKEKRREKKTKTLEAA